MPDNTPERLFMNNSGLNLRLKEFEGDLASANTLKARVLDTLVRNFVNDCHSQGELSDNDKERLSALLATLEERKAGVKAAPVTVPSAAKPAKSQELINAEAALELAQKKYTEDMSKVADFEKKLAYGEKIDALLFKTVAEKANEVISSNIKHVSAVANKQGGKKANLLCALTGVKENEFSTAKGLTSNRRVDEAVKNGNSTVLARSIVDIVSAFEAFKNKTKGKSVEEDTKRVLSVYEVHGKNDFKGIMDSLGKLSLNESTRAKAKTDLNHQRQVAALGLKTAQDTYDKALTNEQGKTPALGKK